MEHFKVTSISIPKFDGKYYDDFRNLIIESVEDSNVYLSVSCFMGASDLHIGDEVIIEFVKKSDTARLSEIQDSHHWSWWNNYQCVSCNYDKVNNDYIVTDFYREAVTEKGHVVKPWSSIHVVSKSDFKICNYFSFCYSIIKTRIEL